MERLISNQIVKDFADYAIQMGYKIYLVGGAVRDYLVDNNCKIVDYDMVTNMPLEKSREFAEAKGLPFVVKNSSLQVCAIDVGDARIECARLRREEYDSCDSHRPVAVTFTDLPEEDVCRRDFTCCAVYYDIKASKMLDFTNGMADITHRRLKMIPTSFGGSLALDPVRILRLIRFALKLNFEIEEQTLAVALERLGRVKELSQQRIEYELNEILKYDCSKLRKEFADLIEQLKSMIK